VILSSHIAPSHKTHETYEGVVKSVDNQMTHFDMSALKLVKQRNENAVTLNVPSRLIGPGDYSVALYRVDGDQDKELIAILQLAMKHESSAHRRLSFG